MPPYDRDAATADYRAREAVAAARPMMARPRLTPEEREERRKARARFSFSDAAYRHYDPRAEGYGSEAEWIAAAEALAAGCTVLKTKSGLNPDLITLNLDELPADIAGLKRAFRNTLHVVHPDKGGTDAATREALAAFGRLSKFYK